MYFCVHIIIYCHISLEYMLESVCAAVWCVFQSAVYSLLVWYQCGVKRTREYTHDLHRVEHPASDHAFDIKCICICVRGHHAAFYGSLFAIQLSGLCIITSITSRVRRHVCQICVFAFVYRPAARTASPGVLNKTRKYKHLLYSLKFKL